MLFTFLVDYKKLLQSYQLFEVCIIFTVLLPIIYVPNTFRRLMTSLIIGRWNYTNIAQVSYN